MNLITVKNLKKEFTTYERGEGFIEAVKSLFKRKKKISKAVKGISFSINKGEIVGFLGPNGAGKSTAIKIMSGVVFPTSGTVNVLGYVPWKERKEYVRNIGVVFGQKSQLFWDLPPVDAFSMHKSIFSIDDKEFEKQLNKLVDLLEIKEVMKKPTRQLSLGERMRCEFVMAMLHKPKIVFLDEPTIGLDVFAKETIRKFVKKINEEEGVTFIVTSHDLEDISHLCKRVIIINEGKIVFDDSITKLKPSKKKYIYIKTREKIDTGRIQQIAGVKNVKKISDFSLTLEADTSKAPLGPLIAKLRAGKHVEDLDVATPPITELIKKLFKA